MENGLISRRMAATALAALCLASASLPGVAAAEEPDATFNIIGVSVALGVGVESASGMLRYQGRTIPISMSGVSVLKVAAANFAAAGSVYHLRDVADFAGNYAAVSAGAGLVRGAAASSMRNDKGVVIEMTSEMGGIAANLGVDALSFSLEQP